MEEFNGHSPADWVLFGVPGDKSAGDAIANICSGTISNRIGQTTLDQLIYELAGCDALLTNDTGTMHLAAFLGVPTAAIFGSTEPEFTAPLGDFHQILRHKVECSPCFRR